VVRVIRVDAGHRRDRDRKRNAEDDQEN